MDFMYSIHFHTAEKEIRRTGTGQFCPSDVSFKIEDMLWQMAETFGRPEKIEVRMSFEREIG